MGRGRILDELDGVVCVAGDAIAISSCMTRHMSFTLILVLIPPQLTAKSEGLEFDSLKWFEGIEKVNRRQKNPPIIPLSIC